MDRMDSNIDVTEAPNLRWHWLLEIVEDLRQRRPDLSTELIDSVYDRLVDLFLGGSGYGSTRSAVFGLIKRQLGWRISDSQRKRFEPDGSFTGHPAAALSLNLVIDSSEGGASGSLQDMVADAPSSGPEVIAESKEALREILESAERSGLNALRAIIGEMVGLAPKEIAETYGVEVATVYKWKSRFVTLYRRRWEAVPASRERSCSNRHA